MELPSTRLRTSSKLEIVERVVFIVVFVRVNVRVFLLLPSRVHFLPYIRVFA